MNYIQTLEIMIKIPDKLNNNNNSCCHTVHVVSVMWNIFKYNYIALNKIVEDSKLEKKWREWIKRVNHA